jgi:hypothetical protein
MEEINCGYRNCKGTRILEVNEVFLCQLHWDMYCKATKKDEQLLAFIKGHLKKEELENYIE